MDVIVDSYINLDGIVIDLILLEKELKKRHPYPDIWYRKQNDKWDRATNFIYSTHYFEELVHKIAKSINDDFPKRDFFYYALNRWYNFWSARAIEEIFIRQPGVVPAINKKDRLVDFTIHGIRFDHKTSRYPKNFKRDIAFAKANPDQLIKWLYTNQSKQQRQHFENRLFVIVHSACGAHYKLKSEISWLQALVEKYVSTFDPSKLKNISIANTNHALADIIWAQR